MSDKAFDQQMMRKALERARRARPSPNPPVGAVVVDADGQLVAAAHHLEAGTPHAEMAALQEARDAARGGTLYVTLEPCNHEGRTPPCVDAILASGVTRVVVGCLDPNPHVAGGGAERLRAAGITVDIGVAAVESRTLIAPWAKFITTGMPHVALKLALSLDGRIASRSGASKWVTGPEARAKVQELRARCDAVAVGIGTAVQDDPRLTVRDRTLLPEGKNPVRIVLDSQLRLPLGSRLVTTAPQVPTWVLTTEQGSPEAEAALVDAGCTVMRVAASAEGRVDVPAALRAIAERGVVSALFEGGAELIGSLLAGQLADELHAFVAPLLLGPRGRSGVVDWAGPETPAEAPRIDSPSWEVCGQDAYAFGVIHYPDRESQS
ncbi:MAG: bifunctional diaminohydroxyphosphoribosylaminopyrimidine deaminase/5-amino-6-(5-phosphoribosylamino)uracil reductase RibD [Polyangiaceae bacterium]|nr:bifunctional diaminohydroxyphosphoribosylaminopyrimidine deaminase/5-amino-6-(5-phosphoribosylamino)uracil reductase RibD [Polyangiaceae bacterium]